MKQGKNKLSDTKHLEIHSISTEGNLVSFISIKQLLKWFASFGMPNPSKIQLIVNRSNISLNFESGCETIKYIYIYIMHAYFNDINHKRHIERHYILYIG